MLLSRLLIRNYRSLEDVTLDDMDRLVVLVGRNNSGKSAVFGALTVVAEAFRDKAIDWTRHITDGDLRRTFVLEAEFLLAEAERQEYMQLLFSQDIRIHHERRETVLASPFATRLRVRFMQRPASNNNLRVAEVALLAEDGKWAEVSGSDHQEGRQARTLTDFTRASPSLQLSAERISHIPATTLGSTLAYFVAESAPNDFWPLTQVARYFTSAFFFSPHRRSSEQLAAEAAPSLTPDGSNLALVLFTTQVNQPATFRAIEDFVHALLPDIGDLRTPLEGSWASVAFAPPETSIWPLRLHNLGSGVEQVLVVATALFTTSNDHALFLEEPESHLHPGAQRALLERLTADGRQVFLTTHAPALVNAPRPRAIYRVTLADRRTSIERIASGGELGAALGDLGVRNSDLLLADAVLFVEGDSERQALEAWSLALRDQIGASLAEANVAILPLGGGDVRRGGPPRRALLEQLDEKSPIPHLFVVDGDERTAEELAGLSRAFGDRLHILRRRELENYLLVPRAIIAALREKHASDRAYLDRIDALTEETVARTITDTAADLRRHVFIRRLRAEIGGLVGGWVDKREADALAEHADQARFGTTLRKHINTRVRRAVSELKVPILVRKLRAELAADWADPARHLSLAPGEEVLDAVYRLVGSRYHKVHDTQHIARAMRAEEIDPELVDLLQRVVSLGRGEAAR